TEAATADVRVAVDAASARFQTIVQMERSQPLQADNLVELTHRGQVCTLGCQSISRREHMARVEADSQALRLRHAREDPGQMFKAMTQARALSCGRLQQNLHAVARAAIVDFVDGIDHALQASLLAATDVRTRMRYQVIQAEAFGPFELDHKRLYRLAIERVMGAGEIDEIGIMSQQSANPRLCQRFSKGANVCVAQRLRSPLVGVLGEELDGLTIILPSSHEGLVTAAGNRQVGTEQWHSISSSGVDDYGWNLPHCSQR